MMGEKKNRTRTEMGGFKHVCNLETLQQAFLRVKRNRGVPGIDGVAIDVVESELQRNLSALHTALQLGTYRPDTVRRVLIPNSPGKTRPLGIPTVRDRVLQSAILQRVLSPITEEIFLDCSYGFRPGRNCQMALWGLLSLLEQGLIWALDADPVKFFDTIPKSLLMQRVTAVVDDAHVQTLIRSIVDAGIVDGLTIFPPINSGNPQGSPISPVLANLVLDDLDMELALNCIESIRYADYLVICCRTQAEAENALTILQNWCNSTGLSIQAADKSPRIEAKDARKSELVFLGHAIRSAGKIISPKLENNRVAIATSTRKINEQGKSGEPEESHQEHQRVSDRVAQQLQGSVPETYLQRVRQAGQDEYPLQGPKPRRQTSHPPTVKHGSGSGRLGEPVGTILNGVEMGYVPEDGGWSAEGWEIWPAVPQARKKRATIFPENREGGNINGT